MKPVDHELPVFRISACDARTCSKIAPGVAIGCSGKGEVVNDAAVVQEATGFQPGGRCHRSGISGRGVELLWSGT